MAEVMKPLASADEKQNMQVADKRLERRVALIAGVLISLTTLIAMLREQWESTLVPPQTRTPSGERRPSEPLSAATPEYLPAPEKVIEFKDVPRKDWYERLEGKIDFPKDRFSPEPIISGYKDIQGTPSGTFGPSDVVNRAEGERKKPD